MRPRTDVPPTLRIGAAASGVVNDALMSIRLSLTVGSRWRTTPASHPPAGAGELTACASKSEGAVSDSVAAAELRRNLRRSIANIGSSSQNLSSRDDRHDYGTRPAHRSAQ